MITIISGTNRPNSFTRRIAEHVSTALQNKTTQPVNTIFLDEYPGDFVHQNMYDSKQQVKWLSDLQDKMIVPAERFIYLSPEYNGSITGVLKAFIDALSVREYGPSFGHKKAAIIGVASGRAGNLRGIDHLVGVLNHVGTVVVPKGMLPISEVKGLFDAQHENLTHEGTIKSIDGVLDRLLEFA